MKKKQQFLIGMMLIVTMLFGSLGVFAKEDVNKFILANKMLNGMEKTNKSDELEMITEQTFKMDFSKMAMNNGVMDDEGLNKIFELYNNLKVRSIIQKTKEHHQVKMEIEVLYKDELVTDGSVYVNDKYIAINIPMLYNKPFYFKWNEIDKMVEMFKAEYGLDIPQISYEKYLEWFNIEKSEEYKKININKYIEMYKEYLESNLKRGKTLRVEIPVDGKIRNVSCKEIVLEQNIQNSFEFIIEFVQKVCNDEAVQALIIAKVNEFIDIAIETEDYKVFNVTLEEINEYKKYLNENSKEIFETVNETINESIDGIRQEFDNEITTIDPAINTKYITKYRFDTDGYLRNVLQENSIQGVKSKQNMTFTKFSNVKIEKVDISNGVNVAEITQQKAVELSEEISNHVQKEVEKNKIIQDIKMNMENEISY